MSLLSLLLFLKHGTWFIHEMMHWLPVFFINIDRWRVASFRHLSWTSCRQKTHLQTYESTFMPYGVSTAAYLGDVFFRITRDFLQFSRSNMLGSLVKTQIHPLFQLQVATNLLLRLVITSIQSFIFWSSLRINRMHYFRHSMHGELPLYSPKKLPCFVGTAIME